MPFYNITQPEAEFDAVISGWILWLELCRRSDLIIIMANFGLKRKTIQNNI